MLYMYPDYIAHRQMLHEGWMLRGPVWWLRWCSFPLRTPPPGASSPRASQSGGRSGPVGGQPLQHPSVCSLLRGVQAAAQDTAALPTS